MIRWGILLEVNISHDMCVKSVKLLHNFLFDIHTLNPLFVPEIKDQAVLVLINKILKQKERALNNKCLQSNQYVSVLLKQTRNSFKFGADYEKRKNKQKWLWNQCLHQIKLCYWLHIASLLMPVLSHIFSLPAGYKMKNTYQSWTYQCIQFWK